MKKQNNSGIFIIFVVVAGLILGAILVSSPGTTSAPSDSEKSAVQSTGQYETFETSSDEVCKVDGKPVVYLFSTTTCPHCTWIKDTFDKWAKDNSDKVTAYHWELDTNDNSLTEEVETEVPEDQMAQYEKFNAEGTVPQFIFGCKYYRVGNGFESESNLDKEVEAYNKVLAELSK